MSTLQPSYELLDLKNPASLISVLIHLGVCHRSEAVRSIEKAGEGNMNLVLRVQTENQSLIVKQSRPWVEKYPAIKAPEQRILAEIDFYELANASPQLSRSMPNLIATDPAQRLVVMQDLGQARDFTFLYSKETNTESVSDSFVLAIQWLSKLHREIKPAASKVGCDALRELNHAHMFSIPLSDAPAIPLDEVCDGLDEASRFVRESEAIKEAFDALGAVYLRGDGPALLHGDYYPGSWLQGEGKFWVIDPEFCFLGPREFDLGILCAHWIFAGAPASAQTINVVAEHYAFDGQFSIPLVRGFCGVEIIRRLIGVAQLPLDADLDRRVAWLQAAREFVDGFKSR